MLLNLKECILIGKLFSCSLPRNILIRNCQYEITKIGSQVHEVSHDGHSIDLVQMDVCGLSGNDSLGYIIPHSNCRWTLRLYNDYLEHKEIEMFVAAATIAMTPIQKM